MELRQITDFSDGEVMTVSNDIGHFHATWLKPMKCPCSTRDGIDEANGTGQFHFMNPASEDQELQPDEVSRGQTAAAVPSIEDDFGDESLGSDNFGVCTMEEGCIVSRMTLWRV